MNRLERALSISLIGFVATTAVGHEPKVILKDNVEATPFPGHETYLLSSADTPANAAVLEIVVPGNTFGAPPHIHAKEDEYFYVLDGEIEFLDRDNTITAGTGTLVVLPRGHLHGFWNLSDQPARMLLLVTPGQFASFFDQVVKKIREEHANKPERIGAIIAQVASQYEVEVHPDKIPESALRLLRQ